jgi:hypothetical protein
MAPRDRRLEGRGPFEEIAIFRDLSHEVLAQIEACRQLRRYAAGDCVCDADPDHGVFAIVAGAR